MRGALGGSAPAFVVDLRGRNMPMSQEFLHFTNIHLGIQQNRGCRSANRMRRINTVFLRGAIRQHNCLHGTRQPLQIMLNQQIHGNGIHRPRGKFFRARTMPGPEEGTTREACFIDVFRNRFRRPQSAHQWCGACRPFHAAEWSPDRHPDESPRP